MTKNSGQTATGRPCGFALQPKEEKFTAPNAQPGGTAHKHPLILACSIVLPVYSSGEQEIQKVECWEDKKGQQNLVFKHPS